MNNIHYPKTIYIHAHLFIHYYEFMGWKVNTRTWLCNYWLKHIISETHRSTNIKENFFSSVSKIDNYERQLILKQFSLKQLSHWQNSFRATQITYLKDNFFQQKGSLALHVQFDECSWKNLVTHKSKLTDSEYFGK